MRDRCRQQWRTPLLLLLIALGTAVVGPPVWSCPADITPPTVTIAKPCTDGQYVTGTAVFIKAYITDDSGIWWAKVYVDDTYKGDMIQESGYWRYYWDSSGTSKGEHKITVKAADNSTNHNVGSADRKVFCHPAISLHSIAFQNDHTLWDRANDIEITEPQFLPGTPPWVKSVAYTISSQMKVNVRMTSTDFGSDEVYVRYLVTGDWSGGDDHDYTDLEKVQPGTFTGSPPSFALAHYPTAPDTVTDYTLSQSYRFYCRKCGHSDCDWCSAGSATASHPRIYLTFGAPVGPWGSSVSGVDRTCWSIIVGDACERMPETGLPGSQEREAMARLARSVYFSGGKSYLSDAYRFYEWRSLQTVKVFRLYDFVRQDTADCQCMAFWWQKLCHSLGADASSMRLQGTFLTEPVVRVGEGSWNSQVFSFHQVGSDGTVFDPCLKVREAPDKNERVPTDESLNGSYKQDVLPDSQTWLPFGEFKLGDVDPFWTAFWGWTVVSGID